MSAFIINQRTMHRAINALIARHAEDIHLDEDLYPVNTDGLTALGRRLYAMNRDAVTTRYGAPALREMDPEDSHEHYVYTSSLVELLIRLPSHTSSLTPFELAFNCGQLKALHCLLYQCGEGDVRRSSLYLDLERQAAELAELIVRHTKEYANSPWD